MIQIAQRLEQISESATLKLNAKAKAMKASGVDVINLTAGEPDFHAPQTAKDAIARAMVENQSKYTPVAGLQELREWICKKTNAQQPELTEPWTPAHVVVSNGGKQALYNALMVLLNPGDEVLIPAPFWLSYPEMVKLAGGVTRLVHTPLENGYQLTIQDLERSITPRTKVLMLNSPSNPTGAVYSKEAYQKIGNWILNQPQAKNLVILSDEIYDRILFTSEKFVSFLGANPKLQGRVITINGMSKSAAMTGWRIGWSVAPAEATSAILKLQGQSTSGINSLAQYASIAALKMSEEEFAYQVESFRKRRDLALAILANAPKLRCVPPQGAFYLFLEVREYLNKGEESLSFCESLLNEAQVAVIPGTPFGDPHAIRISFSTDEDSLKKGCERILKFLESRT